MTAQKIVDMLLEGEHDFAPNIPVKVRTPDGQVIDAMFNGYWNLGSGHVPSVGYSDGKGSWSHGLIHKGDEIVSQVPDPAQWDEMERQRVEKKNQATMQQHQQPQQPVA